MTLKEYQDLVARLYETEQKNCGIHVGDTVCVEAKAGGYKLGWKYCWVLDMGSYIGRTGTVIEIKENEGICVDFGDSPGFYFPFYVLKKVNPAQRKQFIRMLKYTGTQEDVLRQLNLEKEQPMHAGITVQELFFMENGKENPS